MQFGGTRATTMMVNSDTQIIAISPQFTGTPPVTLDVTVTTPGGTSAASAADQFTYTATAASVSSISPTLGNAGGGTVVTITGAASWGRPASTSVPAPPP